MVLARMDVTSPTARLPAPMLSSGSLRVTSADIPEQNGRCSQKFLRKLQQHARTRMWTTVAVQGGWPASQEGPDACPRNRTAGARGSLRSHVRAHCGSNGPINSPSIAPRLPLNCSSTAPTTAPTTAPYYLPRNPRPRVSDNNIEEYY